MRTVHIGEPGRMASSPGKTIPNSGDRGKRELVTLSNSVVSVD